MIARVFSHLPLRRIYLLLFLFLALTHARISHVCTRATPSPIDIQSYQFPRVDERRATTVSPFSITRAESGPEQPVPRADRSSSGVAASGNRRDRQRGRRRGRRRERRRVRGAVWIACKTPMNNSPPLIASIVARDVPRNDVGARRVRFHSRGWRERTGGRPTPTPTPSPTSPRLHLSRWQIWRLCRAPRTISADSG